MEKISSKKRSKIQLFRLWIFVFIFLSVSCFIIFTGCFSHIEPLILKIFNNIDRADHRVSVCIAQSYPGISSNENNSFSIKHLNPDNAYYNKCCDFTISSQFQNPGVNTSGKTAFLLLPATINKFLEKYNSRSATEIKNQNSKETKENSQQDINSDSCNNDGNTLKKGDAQEANPQDSSQAAAESFDLQLLHLINSERKSKNLPGLNFNSTLNNIALSRSTDMLNRGYFSHTTPEGKNIFIILQEKGVGYSSAGENIYYSNPPSSATPEKAFSTWMGSSGHRANILAGHYSQIGIGVASNSEKLAITLVFLN